MLSLPPSLSRADHSLSALRAAGFELLGWGQSAKGLVGPVVIEAVGEGVDEGLEAIEAPGQVVGGVELVSP
jgi:hypothetical protein